jgi:putative nucleotidyltransferase with HDIG domain
MTDIDHLKALPEVLAMIGVEHGKHHCEGDPHIHSMLVLEYVQTHFPDDYILQLAALFHDIGKPKAQSINGDKITFYNHEKIGSRLAYEIMKREGIEKDIAIKVSNIIDNHMRPHLIRKNPTRKAIKKFLLKCGDDLEYILKLCEADCCGKLPVENHVPELRKMLEQHKLKEIEGRWFCFISTNVSFNNYMLGKSFISGISDYLIALDYRGKNNIKFKRINKRIFEQHCKPIFEKDVPEDIVKGVKEKLADPFFEIDLEKWIRSF